MQYFRETYNRLCKTLEEELRRTNDPASVLTIDAMIKELDRLAREETKNN